MYTLSYPLKKEGLIYDKLLKPTLSIRFSPNNTKNMSNLDRVMNINNINSFNRVSSDDGIEGGAGTNQIKVSTGVHRFATDGNINNINEISK